MRLLALLSKDAILARLLNEVADTLVYFGVEDRYTIPIQMIQMRSDIPVE
jgi:hypothetical protein